VRYGELPGAGLKPNASWESALSSLKFDRPGVFDPVPRTEAMKESALADRARHRAFDMAPPTIPHPIEQTSAASCLACHGSGMKVGDRVATKVSHPHYTNCTQCHVESSRPELDRFATPVAENTFQGAYRAGPGGRANPGAPPTIPHTTWMRQDCTSCHGQVARAGIRTTHPWLTSCTQCHAPSAALDQVDFSGWKP
jgi:cytochrome c-type protein NapB